MADIAELIGRYKPDPAAIAAARAIFERAPPRGAGDEELAIYFLDRANAAAQLGEQAERVKAARAAGALKVEPRLHNHILDEWANAEEQFGNILEGIRLRELLLRTETGNTGRRIAANAVLADTYAGLGDLAAGRRLLADSEQRYSRMRSSRTWGQNEVALIERQRGDVHAREGRFAEAEAAYRKAFVAADNDIEINRERVAAGLNTPRQDVIVSMRNYRGEKLARVLLEQGKTAEAEYYARDVLRSALEWSGLGHPKTADALAALGDVMLAQGRFGDAEALARASIHALAEAGIGGSSVRFGRARNRLAGTLVAQERWQDAIGEFERRDASVGNDPGLLQFFGDGNLNFGIALVHTGQFAQAAELLDALHRRWNGNYGDSHLMSATTLAFGALARAGLGQKERARAELSSAIPVLVGQTATDTSEDRGGFVRALRLRWIIEAYLRLLAEAANAPGSAGETALAEAFRLADVARGSGVQRALSASAARATIRDPQLAGLARAEQDAGQRIAALSGILRAVLDRPPAQQLPQVVADMRRDIAELAAERRELKRQILDRFPEYAELMEPRPVTLARARDALRAGEALVSIYSASDRTYLWAVPKEGTVAFATAPIGATQIAAQVASLRKALDVGDVSLAAFPRFDVALAHQLYATLLKPVERGWSPATHLFVVAHRALGQVPFALLVTAPSAATDLAAPFEGYRKIPWLLRRAAVSQLPSVNSLVTLRNAAPPPAERLAFAGFGDPQFSRTPQAAAGGMRGKGGVRDVHTRNLSVGTIDDRGRPVSSNGIGNLAPLPETADEVREIAALMGADMARDVYVGLRATETNVKTADLSRTRVLAFATHGLVPGDLNGLTEPALAMSNPALTGESGVDGLLAMSEVLSLKLDADWVVLSACNTAAAGGEAVEAVSGLGSAFFFAGARALLVSNWPVETVSSRLLTTDLFRRQAADAKLVRAEALRAAMLSLIDAGMAKDAGGKPAYSYAHPMFWAPFTLVGDGGR